MPGEDSYTITYLPTYLPTYLLTGPLTYLARTRTQLLTYLPTYLPTDLLTHLNLPGEDSYEQCALGGRRARGPVLAARQRIRDKGEDVRAVGLGVGEGCERLLDK